MSIDMEDVFKTQLNSVNKQKITFKPKILDHDLPYLKDMIKNYTECFSNIEFDAYIAKTRKELRAQNIIIKIYKKTDLFYVYNKMLKNKEISPNPNFEIFSKSKGGVRENSGVLVVTLVMSPYPNNPDISESHSNKSKDFTCKYDCYYCPKYPDMPRSYIPDEPAVARAIQNDWDPVKQFLSRILTYTQTGIDCKNGIKAEVILEGGTFNSYPKAYRTDFIHKIFYIANLITSNFNDIQYRPMLSLKEEHQINESAFCKIVGLSIETRPDEINQEFIVEMRTCGVTRVQIGVQHTNDYILRKINRGCYLKHTKDAMKLLKNTGFKIAIHIMPDLPFSSPEIDSEMFNTILSDPDISFDYIKIYPVMVTDYTVIKKWYEQGKYKPYSETTTTIMIGNKLCEVNSLVPVIAEFKKNIPPWVRNERIIRDIPIESKSKETIIFGGCKTTNLRQEICKIMDTNGVLCHCIRCREVKQGLVPKKMELVVRSYKAHDGVEYFISYENETRTTIFGFCRLRLPNVLHSELVPELDELNGSALIRELHVYGKMNAVGNSKQQYSAQHIGLGTKMLAKAEEIAINNNYKKISVISAIGTKNYYRKKGYNIENLYLTKNLNQNNKYYIQLFIILIILLVIYLIF